MSGFEAVLFDMDGVLLQGPATPAEVYQHATDDTVDALGLDVSAEEHAPLWKYHYDDQMADCCRDLGVDPATFWETREQFASDRENRRIREGVRAPFPDTEVLADLPVPLGIVSNNRDSTVRFAASELFGDQFAVAIGRDPTVEGFRRRKPNSHYLDRALAALDVEGALYIGDRTSDVDAARAAGIDGGFLRRGHNSKMSFDEPPTVDVEGLDELRSLF
jgi:phosphoglycolate phosphatase-like HAD superfamily hydrolase